MGKVFINDEIFTSDGDYVIGGFVTDKLAGFNFADFRSNLSDRILRLIDEYIERATLYNAELGLEDPASKATEDLALVIKDNFGVEVPYTDSVTVLDTILDTDKMQSWLLGIKENIKDYELTAYSKYRGIPNMANEMNLSSTEYMNAKYFTEESTLESFVEQVSIIEL
jgi:hypothetical protein